MGSILKGWDEKEGVSLVIKDLQMLVVLYNRERKIIAMVANQLE